MAKKNSTIIYFPGHKLPEALTQLIYDNAGFTLRNLSHYAGEVEPGFDYVGGVIPEPYHKARITISSMQDEILESMGLGRPSGKNQDNPNPDDDENLSGGAQDANDGDNSGGEDNNDDGPDNSGAKGSDGDDDSDGPQPGDEEADDEPEEVVPAKTKRVKRSSKK